MTISFKDKVAIVTGAGGGLGNNMPWNWADGALRWWSTTSVAVWMVVAALPARRNRWRRKSVITAAVPCPVQPQ